MVFKLGILIAILCLCFKLTNAQNELSKQTIKQLQKKDDSLKFYGNFIRDGRKDTLRLVADSMFTKILVRALATPYSYQFKFDSVEIISKLEAPDKSFRIFTWQLMVNENNYIQRGVIQKNTADGKPKLYPLFDKSNFLKKLEDSVRNGNNWIGALYYKIIPKTVQGINYFILFGLDRNNAKTDKKWIDVLSFDVEGRPQFGAPIFSFAKDTGKLKTMRPYRYGIEYKKDARVRMNFDEELNLVVYDHLDSEENEPNNKATFIPDGEYEAFEWKNDEWLHIPKLFDYTTKPGDIPQGSLLDDENSNELEKASERNLNNEKKKAEEAAKAKKNKPKVPKTNN
jgi:hypothetical protein